MLSVKCLGCFQHTVALQRITTIKHTSVNKEMRLCDYRRSWLPGTRRCLTCLSFAQRFLQAVRPDVLGRQSHRQLLGGHDATCLIKCHCVAAADELHTSVERCVCQAVRALQEYGEGHGREHGQGQRTVICGLRLLQRSHVTLLFPSAIIRIYFK